MVRRTQRPRGSGTRPYFISPWDTSTQRKWGKKPRSLKDDRFPSREEYEN